MVFRNVWCGKLDEIRTVVYCCKEVDTIDGFEALYKEYYPDVRRFLLKMTAGDVELSEEITQETFYQAFLAIDKFKHESSVFTWLIAIAKNQLFTYYHKRKKEFSIVTESPIFFDDNKIMKQELVEIAFNIIAKLPGTTSEIMLLRIVSGFSYKQISQRLGVSEGSARVLYCRGRIELRKKLREEYDDEL